MRRKAERVARKQAPPRTKEAAGRILGRSLSPKAKHRVPDLRRHQIQQILTCVLTELCTEKPHEDPFPQQLSRQVALHMPSHEREPVVGGAPCLQGRGVDRPLIPRGFWTATSDMSRRQECPRQFRRIHNCLLLD
jgi:hypothetical protein